MRGRRPDKPILIMRALALFILLAGSILAQSPGIAKDSKSDAVKVSEAHFRVHRADGEAATLADIVKAMADTDVVFLGESHNDPAAHYLEAELLRLAVEKYAPLQESSAGSPADDKGANRRSVALSLEMFERDVQTVLDEYLADLITEQQFLSNARAWQNYNSDYRPLVEYARQRKMLVIAANAPRRYVNLVTRKGIESLTHLSAQAKSWLPPLPYADASDAYAEKFRGVMGHILNPQSSGENRPDNTETTKDGEATREERFLRVLAAQSLWDAAMAYSISEILRKQSHSLVIHVNGSFHTEGKMGILDHLSRYRPGTRMLVVTMTPYKGFPNFDSEKHSRMGDFVILTDPSLSKSSRSGS